MNLKLITLSNLRAFFSNLNSKLTGFTTSGRRYKLNQDSNGNYYTNVPWRGVISGNSGILVEENNVFVNNEEIPNYAVSAIPRTKVGNPTCPGYTLYGEYFLSNNPFLDENYDYDNFLLNEETAIEVTQNYNYGGAEIKRVVPRLLTLEEINTLTDTERACGVPYYLANYDGFYNEIDYIRADGAWMTVNTYNLNGMYVRYGFRNPFLDIEDLAVSRRQINAFMKGHSTCTPGFYINDERINEIKKTYVKKDQFSFDSNNKILNISL